MPAFSAPVCCHSEEGLYSRVEVRNTKKVESGMHYQWTEKSFGGERISLVA